MDKEKQARIEHAKILINRGLDLIEEGSRQLHNQLVNIVNPLGGIDLLGKGITDLPRDMTIIKDEHKNEHGARSNSVNKSPRARGLTIHL